ncbi:hypothetical protein BC830DRAFT_1164988 [Chytriomyces sp. MP71]|nr:hypothetical protein BC830DRAFT_1164988 [Chytriomyces sp. MP71]
MRGRPKRHSSATRGPDPTVRTDEDLIGCGRFAEPPVKKTRHGAGWTKVFGSAARVDSGPTAAIAHSALAEDDDIGGINLSSVSYVGHVGGVGSVGGRSVGVDCAATLISNPRAKVIVHRAPHSIPSVPTQRGSSASSVKTQIPITVNRTVSPALTSAPLDPQARTSYYSGPEKHPISPVLPYSFAPRTLKQVYTQLPLQSPTLLEQTTILQPPPIQHRLANSSPTVQSKKSQSFINLLLPDGAPSSRTQSAPSDERASPDPFAEPIPDPIVKAIPSGRIACANAETEIRQAAPRASHAFPNLTSNPMPVIIEKPPGRRDSLALSVNADTSSGPSTRDSITIAKPTEVSPFVTDLSDSVQIVSHQQPMDADVETVAAQNVSQQEPKSDKGQKQCRKMSATTSTTISRSSKSQLRTRPTSRFAEAPTGVPSNPLPPPSPPPLVIAKTHPVPSPIVVAISENCSDKASPFGSPLSHLSELEQYSSSSPRPSPLCSVIKSNADSPRPGSPAVGTPDSREGDAFFLNEFASQPFVDTSSASDSVAVLMDSTTIVSQWLVNQPEPLHPHDAVLATSEKVPFLGHSHLAAPASSFSGVAAPVLLPKICSAADTAARTLTGAAVAMPSVISNCSTSSRRRHAPHDSKSIDDLLLDAFPHPGADSIKVNDGRGDQMVLGLQTDVDALLTAEVDAGEREVLPQMVTELDETLDQTRGWSSLATLDSSPTRLEVDPILEQEAMSAMPNVMESLLIDLGLLEAQQFDSARMEAGQPKVLTVHDFGGLEEDGATSRYSEEVEDRTGLLAGDHEGSFDGIEIQTNEALLQPDEAKGLPYVGLDDDDEEQSCMDMSIEMQERHMRREREFDLEHRQQIELALEQERLELEFERHELRRELEEKKLLANYNEVSEIPTVILDTTRQSSHSLNLYQDAWTQGGLNESMDLDAQDILVLESQAGRQEANSNNGRGMQIEDLKEVVELGDHTLWINRFDPTTRPKPKNKKKRRPPIFLLPMKDWAVRIPNSTFRRYITPEEAANDCLGRGSDPSLSCWKCGGALGLGVGQAEHRCILGDANGRVHYMLATVLFCEGCCEDVGEFGECDCESFGGGSPNADLRMMRRHFLTAVLDGKLEEWNP